MSKRNENVLKRGRRKVGRRVKVAERKLAGRMWHECEVLLMSINDIRKVQPNMHGGGQQRQAVIDVAASQKSRI